MSVNLNGVNSYSAYQNAYKNSTVKEKSSKETAKTENKDSYITNGQKNLSKEAQALLEKIRASRSDMDIMVADFDKGDDAKEVLSRGTKEISVVFSSEELEKMAADEKYYEEKMNSLDGALRMSERINEQFGFERAFGEEGVSISKIGISFNGDGTLSFFAELEKVSEKQRERIEKNLEKKQEAVAEKRVTVQASTEEELLAKIKEIDWSKVKEDTQIEGRKFDFSV